MKIDFATLAFGYRVESGGNTPNWATALGQGRGHKINDDPEIEKILKAMIYSGVPVANTKTRLGKGGIMVSGAEATGAISLSAVFNKVFINDTLINGGRFVLLITKDLTGSHAGRFKLKYGPSNTYDDGTTQFSNQDFFLLVKKQLSLADDACWFVSDINVRNQDELILNTFVVNSKRSETYENVTSLHAAWSAVAPFESPYQGGSDRHFNVAENILLYGVPGCGKSYTIKTDYCDNENYMERVVFHPDFTYSDFVGQILPVVNGEHIKYCFEPGPFTRILKNAIESPEDNFYLVIEEINRGNAPAIFGDVFQLLDRDENGYSEYGVSNENLSDYIYGDTNTKIKIPGNLFVLATMNTSDQNVFTLDTAFKRRWTMRMIENNIDACKLADHQICAWGITWGMFAKTINQKITELGENNLSNEDNRLGAYFVREADLNDAERFGEKVLMYLWNDAFRFDHDKVFKAEYRTLDELITGFIRVGFAVFSDDIVFETIVEETGDVVETDNPTVEQYLEGKNPELVAAYHTLFEAVTSRIPNAYGSSVGSLNYAAWKANDIRKASFADVVIQQNRIIILCEVPASETNKAVGEQIPVDYHHNHYFRIIFDAAKSEHIVDAIVDSYNQLKV